MGRKRIYTEEEANERQKQRYVNYIKDRYNKDAEYREAKKINTYNHYRKKKAEEWIKKNGSIEGFKIRTYNKIETQIKDMDKIENEEKNI